MRPVAAVVSLLLAGCALQAPTTVASTPHSSVASPVPGSAAPSDTSQPTSVTDPIAPCLAMAEGLSLKARAGQLVMVGVSGTLDASERTAITTYKAGSVILMGGTPGGVKGVAKLTASVRKLGGQTGVLFAADQEGGLVQRLKGPGFATIPSAAKQARLSDSALTMAAKGWGTALAKAGVRLDLAPVADVVPAGNVSSNRPIARLGRGYGSDPKKVSAKVGAFRAGLKAAGVESAVKHFPGLGAVKGNTDFAANVVDNTTTATSPLLRPFHDAAAARTGAVMVSSAIYRKIDGKNVAMFSPKVIGILRAWGYEGVVISDDLGAAVAVKHVPASQRAYRLVAAGGDIALTVNPSLASSLVSGLVAHAKSSPSFSRTMTASVGRVLQLKESLGLISCG
jgi:beta-N-acetylhexosaminidase